MNLNDPLRTTDGSAAEGQVGLWMAASNVGVVRTWHNPGGASGDPQSAHAAGRLRARARARPLGGSINEQPVVGGDLVTEELQIGPRQFSVSVCVERLLSQATVKHAMVRLPSNRMEADTPEAMQSIALTIEPGEPVFQHGFQHEEGLYWHLLWPGDWAASDWHAVFRESVPSVPAPIGIMRDGEGYMSATSDSFREKLSANGFDNLRSLLPGNVRLIALVLKFLDLQRAKDLCLMQLVPGIRAGDMSMWIAGEPVDSMLALLLAHRLGPCRFCGHTTCGVYSAAEPEGRPIELASDQPCRRSETAAIYPLNLNYCYGRFTYRCNRCGADLRFGEFLPLHVNPAPALELLKLSPFSEKEE